MDTPTKVAAVLRLACKLEKMRGRDPLEVYLSGNCGNLFYLFEQTKVPKLVSMQSILQAVFPQVTAYGVKGNYGVDHIVTKIDEDYYDITGKLDPKNLAGRLALVSKPILEECTNKYPLFSGWNKSAEDREKRNAEYTQKDLMIIQAYCKHRFKEQ